VEAGTLTYRSAPGRWALTAAILGSGMAFLDSTVVNVALPEIGDTFDAGFSSFQWVINSYLLTLSAFLLVGGSLGDHYGRRRVFLVGTAGFGVASLAVGLAPTIEVLIIARFLQGLAAALLVPTSLAMLQAAFVRDDRPTAIGTWSGFSGLTTIVGPLLGGWLIDVGSWRWAFLINPPVAALIAVIALRHVPESRNESTLGRPDLPAAATAVIALGGIVFALIRGPSAGWGDGIVVGAAAVGVLGIVGFVLAERSARHPIVEPELFRSRQFAAANGTTLAVYFVLSGALFLATLQLRENLGYSALEAGLAGIPISFFLFVLSPLAGKATTKIGPRLPMTIGPIIVGVGTALLARVEPGTTYVATVLPAMALFGIGLGITVAPLTSTALGAVDDRFAGIASAINNTVARAAGLIAVPLLPLLSGMGVVGTDFAGAFAGGYPRAMLIGGAIAVAGGLLSLRYITGLDPADLSDAGPAPPAP
jgi:EmrB/QacA subfamily drug resistance transporter